MYIHVQTIYIHVLNYYVIFDKFCMTREFLQIVLGRQSKGCRFESCTRKRFSHSLFLAVTDLMDASEIVVLVTLKPNGHLA